MQESEKTSQRPLWVQIGLWGLPTRRAVWACFWFSIVVATASAVYGFWERRSFIGLIFLLAAFGYWSLIRWMDRHDSWR